jgi:hypothetical protein
MPSFDPKPAETFREFPVSFAAGDHDCLHFGFPNSASRIPGRGWLFFLSQ